MLLHYHAAKTDTCVRPTGQMCESCQVSRDRGRGRRAQARESRERFIGLQVLHAWEVGDQYARERTDCLPHRRAPSIALLLLDSRYELLDLKSLESESN